MADVKKVSFESAAKFLLNVALFAMLLFALIKIVAPEARDAYQKVVGRDAGVEGQDKRPDAERKADVTGGR